MRSFLYGRDVDRNVKAKARLGLAIVAFAAIYGVIALRLVMFARAERRPRRPPQRRRRTRSPPRGPTSSTATAQILATDVKTPSLFAEPRKLIDVDEAEELLTAVLPDLDANEVRERLSSKRGFVWLKREITPKQQQEIHRLGIPGVGFLTENKRVYPNGPVVSHEIGHVNIDNQGIAGIEKWLDGQGLAALHMAGLATDRLQQPVQLALDLRVQFALRDELVAAREKFKAKASSGIDRSTSTPARSSPWCRSPTTIRTIRARRTIRPASTGSPPASTRWARPSRSLTVAMALDSGKATLDFELRRAPSAALRPVHHPRLPRRSTACSRCRRSSPIRRTSAPRAWRSRVGVDYHKAFLKKIGQLDRLRTELPESAEPLVPKHWGELNTVTIAFGHGLSVAPLQAVMGIAALVNGGQLIPPTFLKRDRGRGRAPGQAGDQARDQPTKCAI